MESASVESLRHCRVCEGLNDSQIERVAQACSLRELEPGETLTFPGDNVLSVYTVIRGCLKMYRGVGHDEERFIGYANLGETFGQVSLLSDRFDNDSRIVAEIESRVAVMSRRRALRLVFEIPRFRENLLVAFGMRVDALVSGEIARRFPKVVGVVSIGPSKRSQQFLPLLVRELVRRKERIAVLTSRKDQFPSDCNVIAMASASDHGEPGDRRALIGKQLADGNRVVIDIHRAPEAVFASQLGEECDEILWCFDNHSGDRNSETLLDSLVCEEPAVKSRIVCVQLNKDGETVGRREPCCPQLARRDFIMPLAEQSDQPSRLQRQAMDRVIRHLRGVKIGLALGGGGARGLAHLGVLKVLDRAGIGFDLMSGTSAGAMIGIGYAAGMPPESMIDVYSKELQPPGLLDRIPGGRRLYLLAKFRGGAWEQMLRSYYHDWSFQQLAIPFFAVATDLVSGQQVVRESGDLVHAILESINVPVMSDPILKDGKILVDGGVMNNLPAELLSDHGAEYVIGVDVSKEIPNHFAGNSSGMPTSQMKKPGNLETAYRIMEVSRRGITQLQMSFADLVIEPDTSAFDFADFTAAKGIAETGEAAAEKVLAEIKTAYDQLMADQ